MKRFLLFAFDPLNAAIKEVFMEDVASRSEAIDLFQRLPYFQCRVIDSETNTVVYQD